MSRDIEIEAKSLISKEDYESLLLKYQEKYPPYIQVNYLLNPSDIPLKDSLLAIRIRVKEKESEFTTKINLEEGKLEINQKLTPNELNLFLNENIIPKGEVYNELLKRKMCNPEKLEIFAILKTTRFDIHGKGHLISVDKSEYLDVVDYEIECESTSMDLALSYLQDFLNKENIPFTRNTISKLKRVKSKLI